MKKFGFTLIELLAVIIILAILALIATPIILDVINDARISATHSEANMIYSGINNYCASIKMKKQLGTLGEDDVDCSSKTTFTEDEIKKMVNLGTAVVESIAYNGGKVTSLVVTNNGYTLKLCGTKFIDNDEICFEGNENDINLAFEYNGSKETPTKLPGKDEGYYVQSVSCQNGTAKWSNDLWALTDIVWENNNMMACKLILGDEPVYDDTIQGDFNNILPSGSNLLIGYSYNKEETKTYTIPIDGSYKVVARLSGSDSSDCAGYYTLRVSLNGTYLTNQDNDCGLNTTYDKVLSLKKGDIITIQHNGYAPKSIFHFIFKQ